MGGWLPTLRPKQVLNAFLKKRAGFYIHHQTGSHIYLKHTTDPTKLVPIPMHAKDLKRGALHGILRLAGFSPEKFLEMLRNS